MPYLVVAVETHVPWTTVDTDVAFSGRTVTLRPGSETLYPAVVLKYEADTQQASDEALALVRRFLSALAWAERSRIREVTSGVAGFPLQLSRFNPRPITQAGPWERDEYLPDPNDEKARRALALYREAVALAQISVPYAFLGYTKILNVKFSNPTDQIAWINAEIALITDRAALDRVAVLRNSHNDIGKYLYGSGRCAVAHAYEHAIDPDDVEDTFRLTQDLPVARALAEQLIEHELGIKSLATIFKEHLYELDGFKKILGDRLIDRLKAGETELETLPTFPKLRISVGRGDVVEAVFDDLRVENLGTAKGTAILHCVSADERLHLLVALYFSEERLGFDPETDVRIRDDGAAEVIDHEINRMCFLRGMLCNGRTEIYNGDTGERLARTDPCVPMNIDIARSLDAIEEITTELRAEREKRTRRLPPE